MRLPPNTLRVVDFVGLKSQTDTLPAAEKDEHGTDGAAKRTTELDDFDDDIPF